MSLGEGELGRALGGLEHFAGAVPRDTFDPAAVAALTGADVDAVFTWVRDQTTLVAYRGALRGPSGVLMDGLGNSLDRALLLQELLRQHGHEVRLARVELTAAQARDLFDRTPAVLAVPPPSSFQALPTTNVEREAEALGIDRAALREGLSRLTEQARFLQEQLVARTEQQASTILATVPPPADDLELERAAQQETLRNHWWVQVLAGGKWLDLDPSLPDAVPGRTIATAAETPTIQTLADMPAALRHTVQLRLILECRGADTLQEHVLLETAPLQPATMIGQLIRIQWVAAGLDQWAGADGAPEAFRQSLLKQNEWTPVLTIGSQRTEGRPYDEHCRFGKAPGPFGGLGGAIMGALAEAAPQGTSGATITGQWIEYELQGPTRPRHVVRRQVFDLLGPAARTSGSRPPVRTPADELAWRLALLGGTDILVLPSNLSADFVDHQLATGMVANQEALAGLWRAAGATGGRPSAAPALRPASSPVYTLALARRAWEGLSGPMYLAEANVLSYHRQARYEERDGFSELRSFDIVAGAVASDARSGRSPYYARVTQGVLDANAEALLASLECRGTRQAVSCDNSANVADAFAQSIRQGSRWRLAKQQTDLHGLPWDDDALARLRADLDAGHLVLVPQQAGGRPVWWRIAAGGETIGLGENGWGQGVDYGHLLNVISFGFCLKGSGRQAGSLAMCALGFLVGGIAVQYAARASAIRQAAAARRAQLYSRLGETGRDVQRVEELLRAEAYGEGALGRPIVRHSARLAKILEELTEKEMQMEVQTRSLDVAIKIWAMANVITFGVGGLGLF